MTRAGNRPGADSVAHLAHPDNRGGPLHRRSMDINLVIALVLAGVALGVAIGLVAFVVGIIRVALTKDIGRVAESEQPAGETKDLRMQLEERGFRPDRIERALTERRIKDENLGLSYAGVAAKAALELDCQVTESDVRNDYRDAGWTWERADRIR